MAEQKYTNSLKNLILALILLCISNHVEAQFMKDSKFKVYRACIGGAITSFQLNSDNSYKLEISYFHCSLCDFEELARTINSEGKWTIKNDTIQIFHPDSHKRTFLLIGDSIIRPLYIVNQIPNSSTDSLIAKLHQKTEFRELHDFKLVYDTYPNGIAKIIIDKYRFLSNEYVIEMNPDGSLKSFDYYRNKKKKKSIK